MSAFLLDSIDPIIELSAPLYCYSIEPTLSFYHQLTSAICRLSFCGRQYDPN